MTFRTCPQHAEAKRKERLLHRHKISIGHSAPCKFGPCRRCSHCSARDTHFALVGKTPEAHRYPSVASRRLPHSHATQILPCPAKRSWDPADRRTASLSESSRADSSHKSKRIFAVPTLVQARVQLHPSPSSSVSVHFSPVSRVPVTSICAAASTMDALDDGVESAMRRSRNRGLRWRGKL